jgi:hypothetical protein
MRAWGWGVLVAGLSALLGRPAAAQLCHNSCNGHGYCNQWGQCDCYSGFQGADCSQKTCAWGTAW